MKQTLPTNIPEQKKQELEDLVKLINKQVKVEFIILFGSYARGNFVEYDETMENGRKRSYASDFDVLVIVSSEARENNLNMWAKIRNTINRKIETPVDLLVHNLQFVNKSLSDGVPFFRDVKEEGIVLFTSHKYKLSSVREMGSVERKKKAEEDFDYYMQKAKNCLKTYDFQFKERLLEEAAFHLHQATENFFIAIQMVFTRYAPKLHNLEKLEKIVSHFDYDPLKIFPRDTDQEKHLFELLKKSYVDSRYNPNFKISTEELNTLFERVKMIETEIEKLCEGKIGEM